MYKLIELPSNKENVRIFECEDWRAVLTEDEDYMHMCITCPRKNKKPTEDQINRAAIMIFCRNDNPLAYIRKSPFTEEVVHLWENNEKARKIVPFV